MAIVNVAYTKYPVGNKQFVIQWDLDPANGADVYAGDTFEAIDCEPVSIAAKSDVGIECELVPSNLNAGGSFPIGPALAFNGDILVPLPDAYFSATPVPALPPPCRYYRPVSQGAAGESKIAILFREL